MNSYRLASVSPGQSQVWDEIHCSERQPAAIPLLPLLSLQEYLGFSIHFKVNVPSAFFGTATFIFRGKQGKRISAETHGLMASLAQRYADSEPQSTWESRSHGQQHSQVPLSPAQQPPNISPWVRGCSGYSSRNLFKLQKHKQAWFLSLLLASADVLWAVTVSLIFLRSSFLLYCTGEKIIASETSLFLHRIISPPCIMFIFNNSAYLGYFRTDNSLK